MNYGYVRVSTAEQNEERQIVALQKHNIDKWFIEKISGKNTNRPKFQEMMSLIQKGDTIYIHDFSRLARSTKDLLDIVETLKQKGVNLVSNKENIDTDTPTGKLMLTMIAAINEFERTNMLERQKEGVEIAKEKGIYKDRCGRKKKEIDREIFLTELECVLNKKSTKTHMACSLGISRPTLYKRLGEVDA